MKNLKKIAVIAIIAAIITVNQGCASSQMAQKDANHDQPNNQKQAKSPGNQFPISEDKLIQKVEGKKFYLVNHGGEWLLVTTDEYGQNPFAQTDLMVAVMRKAKVSNAQISGMWVQPYKGFTAANISNARISGKGGKSIKVTKLYGK